MKAIKNVNVYDYYTYKPNSYIIYDQVILKVGSMKNFDQEVLSGKMEIHDGRGALLMPGLIIGHGHIYSAFVRGISIDFNPTTFTQLLKQLWWRYDGQIDRETIYHSGKVFGVEHIKNGVTTILDHHAGGREIIGSLESLKTAFCDEMGLRGAFCFETSDRYENVDDCIKENLDFAKNNKSDFYTGLFGMHASLSVTDKTLEKISKVIGNIPVHVHVAESLEDEVECLNMYNKRIIQRFNDFGLMNKNSLLAHCVNIDDSEAEIIARNKCTVAVNPVSNMNTSVGLADYEMLKRHKIRTVIGNDSLGTNITRDYQMMLYAQHFRSKSAWKFSYQDLLDCIRNVYEYTSELLDIKVGKLEAGYKADFYTAPYQVATPINETNIFGHIVDGVYPLFRPRDVWVNGELKMKNYETIYDEEKIYNEARKVSKEFWKRIEEDKKWISQQN